jgi:chromosome segregation ATPase
MGRLNDAVKRFDAALAALEGQAESLRNQRDTLADSRAKVAELTEERDRLLTRIADLEEENRSLAGITEEVETRLDGAIGEIRAALGRQ